MIFYTHVNPPQTHLLQIPCFRSWKFLSCKDLKSPCSVHLVYPVYPHPTPLPSRDLMSVPHCFFPSLLRPAPLVRLCVRSHRASAEYTTKKRCKTRKEAEDRLQTCLWCRTTHKFSFLAREFNNVESLRLHRHQETDVMLGHQPIDENSTPLSSGQRPYRPSKSDFSGKTWSDWGFPVHGWLLNTIFAIWVTQEKSWLMVKPRSSRSWSFKYLCLTILLEDDRFPRIEKHISFVKPVSDHFQISRGHTCCLTISGIGLLYDCAVPRTKKKKKKVWKRGRGGYT